MRKKLIIALTVLVCAVALAASLGIASGAAKVKITFSVKGGEATLESVDREISGKVVIPDKVDGFPVTKIKHDAFAYCKKMTSVVIPESVDYIYNGAFTWCISLKEVTFPKSVKVLEGGLFYQCDALKSVVLPDTEELQFAIFEGCNSLESVTLPKSLKKLSPHTFEECPALKSVTIDPSNRYFKTENGMLLDKSGSTVLFAPARSGSAEYTIPSGITTVGERAFTDNSVIKTLIIPKTVKSLKDSAFLGSDFNTVRFEARTAPEMGSSVFESCTSLTDIQLPEKMTALPLGTFCNCTRLQKINIPEKVVSIGGSAFSGCVALKDVTLPEGLKKIEYGTFRSCKSLVSITIPKKVTAIELGAFDECVSLKTVKWGGAEKTIGWHAFQNTAITSVSLPSAVSIGDSAFSGCKSLKGKVALPAVKEIGKSAFSGCTALTGISFGDDLKTLPAGAFNGCKALESIAFSKNGKPLKLANEAFAGLTGLKRLELGSVTSIGDQAFFDCTSLEAVKFPEQLTSIGVSAFENCRSLKSVSIGKNVKSVGGYAFKGCTSLTSAVFSDGACSVIPQYGFYKCTSLKSVKLNGIKVISGNAFAECSSLSGVSIPDTVTEISGGAFYGCVSLKNLYLGSEVLNIGLHAFDNCPSIESISVSVKNAHYSAVDGVLFNKDKTSLIKYPAGSVRTEYTLVPGIVSVREFAFAQAAGLKTVTMAASVVKVDLNAFSGCKFTTLYYDGSYEQWKAGPKGFRLPNDCKVKYGAKILGFNDVAGGGWYLDGISYCLERGYMAGVSETRFGTSSPFTRAMFVTVLAKIDGADLSGYTKDGNGLPFKDVNTSAYYIPALKWAVENGYTSGTGANTFGPGSGVTREQLALFLYNYSAKKGYDVSASAQLDAYSDASKISSWALNGVKWAVGAGMISGTSDTTLSPKSVATRAQIATIVAKYDSNAKVFPKPPADPPAEVGATLIKYYGQNNLSSYQYYGEYNGAYAIRANAMAYAVIVDTEVAGYAFRYNNSIEIQIVKDGEILSLEDAYLSDVISREDVARIWAIHKGGRSVEVNI